MTYLLWLEIALKSFLVGGAALLLLHLLRNRSAAERSWIAHAGLMATVLLPLAIIAGPRWTIEPPVLLAGVFTGNERSIADEADFARQGATIEAYESNPSAGVRDDPADDGSWFTGIELLVLYGAPAILLSLLALLAVTRLHMLRRRADVLIDQTWLTALARAQRRMGFKHGTALLVSKELASPVSWGLVRPVIVLDEKAVGAGAQAEAIIAHELAHVARLDWAKLLVGRAATAIYWFNPLVWLLVRQCHQLREEAADDAVLQSGVANDEYAALLVDAARHESRALLLAANGVAPGRDSLKRRVARVLDTSLRRSPVAAAWSSICGAVAILIAVPLAAVTPSAASPSETTAVPSLSRFNALEMHGRGNIVLRHGSEPRVTLVRGSSEKTDFTVDHQNRLVIRACVASCSGYLPKIEIVAPRIDVMAVSGGGTIQAQDDMPAQPSLALQISNGGLILLDRLEADRVTARVDGGGTIKTRVRNDLNATVIGEGSIVYWGNPSINSSIDGGGVVVGALES